MIVYIATHRHSGKSYVGLTKFSLEKRKRQHCVPRSKSVFSQAIAKYGLDAFDWSILQICATPQVLAERERSWIKELGTLHPGGYNFTSGGDGALDMPPEVRQRISKSKMGKKQSEETKAKRAAKAKGRKMSPEFGAKIRARMLGTHLSEQTRRRLSEIQKGQKRSPRSLEIRAKISASHMGKRLSPEHRAASSKGWFTGKSWNEGLTLSAERRARMSEAHKGKTHSEETRAKMRESHRRRLVAF